MTIKNNIQFRDYTQAFNCAKVLYRIPQVWNEDIQKSISFLTEKIWEKEPNEDGTVRIRLPKEWTENYGKHLATHIHSVETMYKKEYADAFKIIFKAENKEEYDKHFRTDGMGRDLDYDKDAFSPNVNVSLLTRSVAKEMDWISDDEKAKRNTNKFRK